MTIAQLLKMPIGYKTGGFDVTVKTAKKKWQVGADWIQQVCVMDKTGEMLADLNTSLGYGGFMQPTQSFHITVAEVQGSENGKKLYVSQWVPPIWAGDPGDMLDPQAQAIQDEAVAITRGKIRHGLVCSYIRAKKEPDKNEIRKWTEFIVTGK